MVGADGSALLMLKMYSGNCSLTLLFVASLIYLWITEKNKLKINKNCRKLTKNYPKLQGAFLRQFTSIKSSINVNLRLLFVFAPMNAARCIGG